MDKIYFKAKMARHRCVAVSLAPTGLLYMGGCGNSFAPDVDLLSSEGVNAERVRVVREYYQTALEKEQNTPLKLRKGAFKVVDDSSNVSETMDDSTIAAALAKMVQQYPPDWDNAETWNTEGGGYIFATLLEQNGANINPTGIKVSVVRILVADVNLKGTVIPGSMRLIEFVGQNLEVSQFKDYVTQWLAGDFGETYILVAEYTIGYASTGAFFYQPDKEPERVTIALQRTTAAGKTQTQDIICYTVVEWEELCLIAIAPAMGETCEWVGFLSTTCVDNPTGGGGGGEGSDGNECNSETGSCGGGGGGNNGDSSDGQDENETLELSLSCPTSVLRGDVVKCQIVFEGDSEDLGKFTWSSDWGASHTGLSWEGIATDDVTISASDSSWSSEAKITITDRSWDAPPSLNPSVKYRQLPSGKGGEFRLVTARPQSGAGTGPWNSRHYVQSEPTFRAELYISKNYDTDWHQRIFLPKYSFSYGSLSSAAKAACSEAQSITSRSVSYWYLNDTCGIEGVWENMRDQIRSHEREHQAGHNSCLRSTTTSEFFSDLEQLTGAKSAIDIELTSGSGMWEVYWEKLKRAGSYASPTRSIAPFFYHVGHWVYAMRTGGNHPYAPPGC